MSHSIVYESWTFPEDKIKEGNLYLATSLLASSLEVNSFVPVVACDDPSILDFQRNAKLLYYVTPGRPMVFRVQNIKRVGPNLYEISSTSTLGLLTEGQHMGGIYTGQEAEEVILDICGTVPVEIKHILKKIKLYGWLPIATPRDNLAQVLFAIGAALKTDLAGVLRIEGLWDGISGQISQDNMYVDADVDYSARITGVIVAEHQYTPGTEERQLFEGTTQAGDIITFEEPMHTLSAQGFTIQASGANWARVSAGVGTLKGRVYIHNTRQVSKTVQTANTPNVKTVEAATLVSLVNSAAVAERLVNYYRCRERIDAPVVYQGESPGDRVAVYHPFDKNVVDACLESTDITLSNSTLKAQEKLLVGYVPPQMAEAEYIDTSKEITQSGKFQIPDGVTEITAVCIGGGQGGQRGRDGEKGGDGTNAYTYGNLPKPSGMEQGKPGPGGAGGAPGSGGSGGKVLVANINVAGISELTITVAYAGSANGGYGGASTVTAGSKTYSSESGSSFSGGYTDIITGKTYAAPGLPGSYSGGKGGSGVSGTSGSGEAGASVAGYSGGQGNNYAYNLGASTYRLPAGGGGAAYGGTGAAATNANAGGAGGNAAQNRPAPTVRGCGGHGGNGGGGGGGGGAGYIDGGLPSTHKTASAGYGGDGGTGSSGTAGAPGIVLLFYREPKIAPAGQLVDKNNKMILDRLGRRIIM